MTNCQNIGPTITLTLMNLVFSSTLPTQLNQHAPQVNATNIIYAGSTGFRSIVSPAELPSVLVSYSNSVERVVYLVAGLAAASGIAVWGMGWHDIRKTKDGDV